MADLRVITPSERHILHRVDSSGLRFQVKVPLPGLGPTLSLHSRSLPFSELYKIVIGRQTKVINMVDRNMEVATFSNDLDFRQFQVFWITWYNKKIKMGVWGHEKPFLEYPMSSCENVHDIGYAMFNTASMNWAPVEWVIETAPTISKEITPKKFDGRLRWVAMQANDRLPIDAMIGGFEVEPIYIARAHHNNSLCPGKYVRSQGMAYVPWGFEEHSKSVFEVLCGYNAKWEKTRENNIPTNAFVGGRSEVQNEPLYIGRAMIDNKLICGKVHVRYCSCYLPSNGKEIKTSIYEILVIPQDEIPQTVTVNPLLKEVAPLRRTGDKRLRNFRCLVRRNE